MSFKFSKRSLERLNTCSPELIKIFNEALAISVVDFGIAEGHRSTERQYELFKKNTPTFTFTKCDGYKKLSKHNHQPSRAVDIYAWVNGKVSYSPEYFYYIAGIISAVANKHNVAIRWGGNWDGDGDFKDNNFLDFPHFELK